MTLTRRPILVTAIAALLLLVTAPVPHAAAAPGTGFTRMFGTLPRLAEPTVQQLADLAQTMLDPASPREDNTFGSGFTYFGQFLDHDLTLDPSPVPTAFENPDTDGTQNGRTFSFDLDSVYGGPQLFDATGRFLLQQPNANGVNDFPRNPDGSAIIAESRNDENEIISQLQVAIMRDHNKLIGEGLDFTRARDTLLEAYHRAIVDDYLPHVLCACPIPTITPPAADPLEFAVAAFRFGHSQVRDAYELNEASGKIPVFSLTLPDLRGGRAIPAGRQIDWNNFFVDLADPNDPNGINHSRKIDTLISAPLFQLPIPITEASGSNVLGFRNLQRGHFYSLPSGESVAGALGLPAIPVPGKGPGFERGTPLWFYILAESSALQNGLHLGPVGSAIVNASFQTALAAAAVPADQVDAAKLAEIAGPDRAMSISDLVVFAR